MDQTQSQKMKLDPMVAIGNGRRQEGVQMYEFGLMVFEGTRNGGV
ncbi:uncharacterized protein G2W53_004539 [Senna tora]|uniref:Uncharacterized protein n=1 Tax=Senna tora TaxID=362788 RepID=A0A834XDN9_9FABA|nr:uncharacterized protein G2W53_004539 [Senna tora]